MPRSVASVLLTGSLIELGDRTAYVDTAAATARLASRRRNSYAQVALGWIDLSLASLRRDAAAVDRLAAELHALRPRLNPGNEALHLMGIHLISHLWDERIGELIEPIAAAIAVADNDMAADVLLLAIARAGEPDRLRAQLLTPVMHRVDNWSSTSTWCGVAEAAAVAGDVPLAEQMAARLAPLHGRLAISGISTVMGPVDGYLALALAATGRRREAADAAATRDGPVRGVGLHGVRRLAGRAPRAARLLRGLGAPLGSSTQAASKCARRCRPQGHRVSPTRTQETTMSSYLFRLGRSSAAHPWRVISAWVLLVATAAALASSFGAPLRDDWDVPGARAQQGIDLLREHGVGGYASARVVVHDREGDALPADGARRADQPAPGPRARGRGQAGPLSADRDTAVLTVQYAEPITHPDLMGNIKPLEGAIAGTIDAG